MGNLEEHKGVGARRESAGGGQGLGSQSRELGCLEPCRPQQKDLVRLRGRSQHCSGTGPPLVDFEPSPPGSGMGIPGWWGLIPSKTKGP